LPDKENKIGICIERPLQNIEAFWPEFLLNATQNLSGFLAVRSSGEDERQAQDFAAVARDQRLFAIRELHGKLGCFSRKFGGEGGAGKKRQRKECFRAH
jgi:hypothetical protein